MFDRLLENCLYEEAVQGFKKSSATLERQIFRMLQKVLEDHIEYGDTEPGDVIIKSVEIMGSRLHGTAKPDSDLDVLVTYTGSDSESLAFWTLRPVESSIHSEINGIRIDVTPKKVG